MFKQIDNDGSLVMITARYAPDQELVPAPHLVNDGKADVSANIPAEFNPRTAQYFQHLKPRWK
jgi:hypothetical protein